MNRPYSFGEWLRRQRRALDWTQEDLAKQAGCAAGTIRKIEADELRPSKQLAEVLAQRLEVAPQDRAEFVRFARGVLRDTSPILPLGETVSFPSVRRHVAQRHNLPTPLTSFIARERDVTEVKQLLARARLLTLTGSGGCGKTRLALQVAMNLLSDFKEGVWWVELAPLADAALVPQAVAAVLGVREEQAGSLLERVADYGRAKNLLLILDNCEHLLDACARFADTFLGACPGARILATSREAMGILGETVWRVPSLTVPNLQVLTPAEPWMSFEAIHLFAERATAADARFRLTEQNAPSIAQICARLDGIPLAIELAAARVPILTPDQIAARLDDRFNLLISGNRAALPRHQTLRALTDWSYDLLSEPERELLRRLSVFVGGFTLQAVEAIGAEDQPTSTATGVQPNQALGLLSQLVAKSLVSVERSDPDLRYSLLETIRQYAYEKLVQAGEAERVRNFHMGFFLRLAEETDLTPGVAQTGAWPNRFEPEFENLWAALRWAEESQSTGAAMRLVCTLCELWELNGYYSAARERLAAVLGMPATREPAWMHLRAITLLYAGHAAEWQSDYAAGVPLTHEALAIFKQLNDRKWIAISLSVLMFEAWTQGEYATARALSEEELAICSEMGDELATANARLDLALSLREAGDLAAARALMEQVLRVQRDLGNRRVVAVSLMHTGATAHAQDDPAASDLLEESLTIFHDLGDKLNEARCLHDLGAVAARKGDQVLARARFVTSLTLLHQGGDWRNLIKCLEGLAGVLVAEGRMKKAVRLFGAAEAFRQALGTPLPGSYRTNYERNLASLRQTLDGASLAAAWAGGHAMTMERAIAYALEEGGEPPS